MNIDLIAVGKTDSSAVSEIVAEYSRRINRYAKFSVVMLPDVKKGRMAESVQKRTEGEMLLKQFAPDDFVVLLDDKGAPYSSMEFAAWIQKRMNSGVRRLCFVIGGPYGFSKDVYARANDAVSLSRMTFSHQIVRAIFAEQLYRAFSILNNEPYHHE